MGRTVRRQEWLEWRRQSRVASNEVGEERGCDQQGAGMAQSGPLWLALQECAWNVFRALNAPVSSQALHMPFLNLESLPPDHDTAPLFNDAGLGFNATSSERIFSSPPSTPTRLNFAYEIITVKNKKFHALCKTQ